MKRILENEIYRLIKRYPTEDELNSAIEYLDFCSDDLTDYESIPGLLQDWLGDKMAKCEYCGTWGLRINMEEEFGNWWCDSTCFKEAREGLDMHAEACAEYTASNR